jgi:hypothetical protein
MALQQQSEHDDAIDNISDLTTGSVDDRADAYTKLLKKEARVLKTVDRVVNQARTDVVRGDTFLNLSITDIGLRTMRVMQLILDDMLHVRSLDDAMRVLWDGERKIYVGIVVISIAFVMFFATASN